jgi:hypothetical protein
MLSQIKSGRVWIFKEMLGYVSLCYVRTGVNTLDQVSSS